MPEGGSLKEATNAEVVQDVSNWLIDRGLMGADFESLLSGFSERLVDAGVPLGRAMIGMRTLHPSIDAEAMFWRAGGHIESERFEIDTSEDSGWSRSPMRHMLDTGATTLRRRLEGAGAVADFPVLDDLRAEGFSDYYARIVPFEIANARAGGHGLISAWSTKAAGGFSDNDLAVLDRLIPRLALTAKSTLTQEIAETVLDT